jgi:DNA-binding MarR family transcriptional regulator
MSELAPKASSPLGFRERNLARGLVRAAWMVELQTLLKLHAAGFTDYRKSDAPLFRNLGVEGRRITDLAHRAGITKQGMAKLTQTLEKRGYLERAPDPTDGRAFLLVYTARGRALLEASATVMREIEREWAEQIGTELVAELPEKLLAATRALGATDDV